MRIGIIDLGTNSVRLLVYEKADDGSLLNILQEKEMVQLGENLFEDLLITPKAQKRTVKALEHFSQLMDKLEVKEIHAIATSAMREATNADMLKSRVAKKTGINLEVISGDKEAELIALGILKAHGPYQSPQLLVDIGGGSTEVTVVNGSTILSSKSLQLGAVRCQERELERSYPPTSEGVEKLRHSLRQHIDPFLSSLKKEDMPKTLIGSSGSIRALLRISSGMQTDSPVCSREELQLKCKELINKRYKKLRKNYGFERRRAQVIVAAAILLDEIVEVFDINTLTAVPQGLKDGMVAMLEAQQR